MNEQIKKIVDPVRNFWGKLTKKTKIVFFVCLGAAVLFAVVAGVAMNRTQYTMLYSGLSSTEGQTITNELHTLGVDYKYDNGTIYVDKTKEDSTRMSLANEGYPKSVPNYDFFTKNVGVMTTDEERKIIEQYQLEERLGAVIKTLDSVDTAYVTISLPENTSYAWEDNKSAATASVAVALADGKTLDAKQVNGIKQLVSKSVPNLTTANVTVMDTSTGDELTASSSESSGSTQITLSEFKLKIEKQYEDNLQSKILNLLAQAYGRGNISVSVKSRMDLDKKIQDIVTYTPSTSDGKGVVSHTEEMNETVTNNSSAAGGVAGTQSNTDTTTTTYPGVTVNSGVITTKDSKTYDYLVSKVEEQIQSDAAALDDLTVAVVVNTNGMTDAKKQEVTSLVANAAAVDASKVAIMAAPVSSVESQQEQQTFGDLTTMLSNNKVILIAGAVLLLLLILLIVLVTAKRRNARREQLLANLQPAVPLEPMPEGEELGAPEEEGAEEETEEGEESTEGAEGETPPEETQPTEEEEETMPTESIEEIRNASGGKEQRVKSELLDFSDKNPEIAAQLIRSWLKGDDNKHG